MIQDWTPSAAFDEERFRAAFSADSNSAALDAWNEVRKQTALILLASFSHWSCTETHPAEVN
ncbi:MAG: hypothetical protein K1X67_17320 [Fimbriimonadaceae bacterium]|nr:hypothetical protein [Fimbriimonadaceae bacterium]